MGGSLALHRDLGVVALTIHTHGDADGWRRVSTTYDHAVSTGQPAFVIQTQIGIAATEDNSDGVASFDAVCGEDTCRIESVYFNE